MCTNLLASAGLIASWRHSWIDITWQAERSWEKERVCQTYDQTDNSTSELDLHHSHWLCPLHTHHPLLPSLCSLSPSVSLLAGGDHSIGLELFPEALPHKCSVPSVSLMERGYQCKHLPFLSLLQGKGLRKELGQRYWAVILVGIKQGC